MCGARAEPPALPSPGVLPSAYLPTATGVFWDRPAPEPEPGRAARLLGPGPTPRTPAQTEVPPPRPCWPCSGPCARPPTTLSLSLGGSSAPQGADPPVGRKRARERPAASLRTRCSPPSRQQGDHLAGAAPRVQRSRKTGLRCGDADPMSQSRLSVLPASPRSSLDGFPQGARPSAGSALGWKYLTPRPAQDRPSSRQNGLCFQPKSITHIHTPPTRRRPVCTSAGVTRRIGVLRAGGRGRTQTGEGWGLPPEGWMMRRGVMSSQKGSRPSLRPLGPGQGPERLIFPAFLELIFFDWVCRSHLSGQSLRQRGIGFPVAWGWSGFLPARMEGFHLRGHTVLLSEPGVSPEAETLLLLFPTG